MHNRVELYDIKVGTRDLEVINSIAKEYDARKKAELILSLSREGLIYAIYNGSLKSRWDEHELEMFDVSVVPLLFALVVQEMRMIPNFKYRHSHLSFAQLELCRSMMNILKSQVSSPSYYGLLEVEISDNNCVHANAVDFFVRVARTYSPSDMNEFSIASEYDLSFMVYFPRQAFDTLHTMFWILRTSCKK